MRRGVSVKTIKVRVHGWVHGVFYRDTTRAEAERLGLRGWVRNLSDGTVLLLLQGDAEAIEAMLEWCRVGPPGADVSWLDVENTERDDTLSGFQIR